MKVASASSYDRLPCVRPTVLLRKGTKLGKTLHADANMQTPVEMQQKATKASTAVEAKIPRKEMN